MAAARHPGRAGDAQPPRSSRPRGGDPFAPSAPAGDRDRARIARLIAATRLRGFAPFDAMLLHIQKPGLTHAATAQDWWARFGNVPKTGARPLLTLRAMGPVDFSSTSRARPCPTPPSASRRWAP